MRHFKLYLPQSFQHLTIMKASNAIQQQPFLDGYLGFYFLVVRESATKKLAAFVLFDRNLELDEEVLLRLKYNGVKEAFDIETRNMRRFDIAPQQLPKIEEKND